MKYEDIRNDDDARQFYGMCAAVAMKGLIVANKGTHGEFAAIASAAFNIADAMMQEWERRLSRTGEIGS